MATRNDLQIIDGGRWSGTYAWLFNDKRYQIDNIYINNKWVSGLRVCDPKRPVIVLSTNNTNERYLREFLPALKGAKRVFHKVCNNYDEDPYGRKIKCGTYSYEIWDLRSLFDCTKDITDFLNYEEREMLKNYKG